MLFLNWCMELTFTPMRNFSSTGRSSLSLYFFFPLTVATSSSTNTTENSIIPLYNCIMKDKSNEIWKLHVKARFKGFCWLLAKKSINSKLYA